MTGRRGLVAAMLGCAVAGALVLIAAGRTWGHRSLVAETGAHVSASVTGHTVEPALPALGLALLVLAGAVVAARSWLRRAVGLVVVALSGAVIGLAASSSGDVAAALRERAFGVARADVPPQFSGWAAVCIAAGAVGVAAGALTVVVGARWPALGARYEPPAGAAAGVRARPGPARGEDEVAWDALDRGDDPTA